MENDQFDITAQGMEEVARTGAAFEKDRSTSTLVTFQDSLRAIRAEITAIDLQSLSPDKRERITTWLNTVDGWTQAVERLMRKTGSENKS